MVFRRQRRHGSPSRGGSSRAGSAGRGLDYGGASSGSARYSGGSVLLDHHIRSHFSGIVVLHLYPKHQFGPTLTDLRTAYTFSEAFFSTRHGSVLLLVPG